MLEQVSPVQEVHRVGGGGQNGEEVEAGDGWSRSRRGVGLAVMVHTRRSTAAKKDATGCASTCNNCASI